MTQVPDTIDLAEACQILKISRGYGYQIWTNWRNCGVRVLQHQPNARPRFYAQDILKMMERKK
ncbi:MAG: hypothetical protein ACYDFR_03220 [Candidatus Omnitrophota bacterium]